MSIRSQTGTYDFTSCFKVGNYISQITQTMISADRSRDLDIPVLQTTVTSSPNAFASCTGNVPTPPVAPPRADGPAAAVATIPGCGGSGCRACVVL
jgi:hypothetical protein